ncbi:phage antirepressor Ant [Enterobacter hormaechei]|uniref:phage antirepressor N-terminal domain-containing protein n=1 Tax=Enterobacter TaxID=547 RepID=UPI00069906C2|nr:phage antirepressor N-terminal domain-containing protein [Enterobacter hormaechei]EBG4951535.1 phage antirepressor Ant [Salmonella enterica subsp. enterica serovar Thompson]MBJ9516081.1 phage antirepressor Ant [Citrobacter freundii]HED5618776.1 phage antirepressor Ant [Enterobacter cloacae]ECD7769197.1 phage antirepressor Ant [Salmonella enterica subsp. enterica serovar Thompson]EKS6306793.1 phage antirepressor Ant [Enterobacter hormaechei]
MNSIAILEAVNTTSLPFHGQHIITALAAGISYVAMKPIVENIGLDWASQFVKLKKQGEKFGCCDITIPSLGGLQRMLCLPLKKLNGWLFSINPAKVRDDIRDRLIRYQEECFTALHDYWTKGVAVRSAPETSVDDRTPLRGIVNRIMGKYGMTYQAVYKMVHKEFGVKHIDELSPKQTAEAIEYLAGKVIEGEFIGKEKHQPVKPQFNDEELISLCYLQLWMEKSQRVSQQLYPAMKQAKSEYAGMLYDIAHDIRYMTGETKKILLREAQSLDSSNIVVKHAQPMLAMLRGEEWTH